MAEDATSEYAKIDWDKYKTDGDKTLIIEASIKEIRDGLIKPLSDSIVDAMNVNVKTLQTQNNLIQTQNNLIKTIINLMTIMNMGISEEVYSSDSDEVNQTTMSDIKEKAAGNDDTKAHSKADQDQAQTLAVQEIERALKAMVLSGVYVDLKSDLMMAEVKKEPFPSTIPKEFWLDLKKAVSKYAGDFTKTINNLDHNSKDNHNYNDKFDITI